MEEETRQRADGRNDLNIGKTVEPVEKTFNRLANRTDKDRKRVAGNQSILFTLLSSSQELGRMILCDRHFPGSVDVSIVSIQTALLDRSMIFQDLFGGRQVVQGSARSHKGDRKGQTP